MGLENIILNITVMYYSSIGIRLFVVLGGMI